MPAFPGQCSARGVTRPGAAALRELKRGDGPDLLTQGSTDLVHRLLATALVDELRLLVYPILLGRGKRLFDDDAQASRSGSKHRRPSPPAC